MSGTIPFPIKIYHIVHIDRLPYILEDGGLFCDAVMQQRHGNTGMPIGMKKIKRRRLEELRLQSYPDIHVGDCVPFYFCPRSVMLYLFHAGNHPEIDYHGGQAPIIHLVADMRETESWASKNHFRFAFTSSNAGSSYFEDFTEEKDLDKLDWDVIGSSHWQGNTDVKQAEFLLEKACSWNLIQMIGVYSDKQYKQVNEALSQTSHHPRIEIKRDWYY